MKIDLLCPVELYDFTLPTAEQPYCSLVLLNLSSKAVRSVQVALTLLDADGNPLFRRVERVMGLDANSKELFEANVAVENDGWIRRIDLVIEKVWFDDATIWRIGETLHQEYQPNALPAGRLLDQLKVIAGKDAAGFPSDQRAVWVCVCGRPNAQDEAVCIRCDRDRQQVFEHFTPAKVQAQIEERERKQQEQAKLEHEEAARKEAERKATERRRRRKHRILVASMVSALVLVVGTYLFVAYGWPELRYRQADRLLADGDARQAKAVFASLGTYRQADQRTLDSDFAYAQQLLASQDPQEQAQGLALLDGMTDYPQAAPEAQAFRYHQAQRDIDAGNYENAEALLIQLGDYQDTADKRLAVSYQIASKAMEQGEFDLATQRFTALGAYQDAADRRVESIYRSASKKSDDGEYMQAATLFRSILSYQDSVERARNCIYQYALSLKVAEKYDEAKTQFEKLGAYLDSAQQAQDCVYIPAKALMDIKSYDQAAALFASIPSYTDASDLSKECTYQAAVAKRAKGEFEQAAVQFATIPGYKDADALAKSAAYDQASALVTDGQLEKGAQAFDALGDANDSAERAQEARYQLAVQAQDAKDYAQAETLFQALGTYKDSADRIKDCKLVRAQALMDAKDWAAAATLFRELGEYQGASALANQCDYNRAEALRANNQLDEAAAIFVTLGKYQDAATMVSKCRYERAEQYELARDYAAAGKAFAELGSYSDAKARSEKAYDTWLGDVKTKVDAAMRAENYTLALQLLEKDIPLNDLPKAYAGLAEAFRTANLMYARQLISVGNPFAAYPYLMQIRAQKDAKELLSTTIFTLIGTWEGEDGTRMVLRPDGTCLFNGQEQYFNATSYGMMIGATPLPQKRTHTIIMVADRKLVIKDDTTKAYLRFNLIDEATAAPNK